MKQHKYWNNLISVYSWCQNPSSSKCQEALSVTSEPLYKHLAYVSWSELSDFITLRITLLRSVTTGETELLHKYALAADLHTESVCESVSECVSVFYEPVRLDEDDNIKRFFNKTSIMYLKTLWKKWVHHRAIFLHVARTVPRSDFCIKLIILSHLRVVCSII